MLTRFNIPPPLHFYFFIFHSILRLVSASIPHASRCPRPRRTDNSRPAVRSKLSHQHQGNHAIRGNHKDCPYIFVLRTNPNRLSPIQTINNTQTVGANLVFALSIFVFALILHSHFVLRTNRPAYAPRREPACAKVSEEKRRTV